MVTLEDTIATLRNWINTLLNWLLRNNEPLEKIWKIRLASGTFDFTKRYKELEAGQKPNKLKK
jgi:hypothetical protein